MCAGTACAGLASLICLSHLTKPPLGRPLPGSALTPLQERGLWTMVAKHAPSLPGPTCSSRLFPVSGPAQGPVPGGFLMGQEELWNLLWEHEGFCGGSMWQARPPVGSCSLQGSRSHLYSQERCILGRTAVDKGHKLEIRTVTGGSKSLGKRH